MTDFKVSIERTEKKTISIPAVVFAEYLRDIQPPREAIEDALQRMEKGEPFDADIVRWTFDSALMVVEAIAEAVKDGRETRCPVSDVTVRDDIHGENEWARLRTEHVLAWLRQWREAQP